MLILALDLARSTGFAFGSAGSIPTSGSWELRAKDESALLEPSRLGRELERLTSPDLIVVEEPLTAAAKWQMRDGAGKQHAHSISLQNQHTLHGGLLMWAGLRRIKVHRISVATVRKHLCGKASAGDSDSTKRMVRDRLVLLGLVPRGTKDLDQTDAVAVWRWAEDNIARVRGPFALLSA